MFLGFSGSHTESPRHGAPHAGNHAGSGQHSSPCPTTQLERSAPDNDTEEQAPMRSTHTPVAKPWEGKPENTRQRSAKHHPTETKSQRLGLRHADQNNLVFVLGIWLSVFHAQLCNPLSKRHQNPRMKHSASQAEKPTAGQRSLTFELTGKARRNHPAQNRKTRPAGPCPVERPVREPLHKLTSAMSVHRPVELTCSADTKNQRLTCCGWSPATLMLDRS